MHIEYIKNKIKQNILAETKQKSVNLFPLLWSLFTDFER